MIVWLLVRHPGRAPCPPRPLVPLAPMSPCRGGTAPSPRRSNTRDGLLVFDFVNASVPPWPVYCIVSAGSREDMRCRIRHMRVAIIAGNGGMSMVVHRVMVDAEKHRTT